MLERKVIHVSGRARATPDAFRIMAGISTATYEGTVKDVASGVLAECRRLGYKVRSRLMWSPDGEIREVHATTTGVSAVDRWHLFTTASDPWPMLNEGAGA